MENKGREELNKKLHKLIDGIEDEHILNMLNKDVINYMVSTMNEHINDDEDELDDDDLTEKELQDLDDSIAEVDRGETISIEEFKKNMEEMRARLISGD
jgi:hypothetical protein